MCYMILRRVYLMSCVKARWRCRTILLITTVPLSCGRRSARRMVMTIRRMFRLMVEFYIRPVTLYILVPMVIRMMNSVSVWKMILNVVTWLPYLTSGLVRRNRPATSLRTTTCRRSAWHLWMVSWLSVILTCKFTVLLIVCTVDRKHNDI